MLCCAGFVFKKSNGIQIKKWFRNIQKMVLVYWIYQDHFLYITKYTIFSNLYFSYKTVGTWPWIAGNLLKVPPPPQLIYIKCQSFWILLIPKLYYFKPLETSMIILNCYDYWRILHSGKIKVGGMIYTTSLPRMCQWVRHFRIKIVLLQTVQCIAVFLFTLWMLLMSAWVR